MYRENRYQLLSTLISGIQNFSVYMYLMFDDDDDDDVMGVLQWFKVV